MKKIFRNMAYALLGGLMLSACSAEEFSGANGELPNVADFADNFKIDVDQETNTANFSFDGKAGITPIWVIDGAYSSAFNLSKYYRKKGTYDVECFVKNRNGISKESIKKQFTVEKTKMNGFGGFVEDSEFNLFKKIAFPEQPSAGYYAPGWSQIADPVCTYSKGCYTLKLPEATTERWQAQVPFTNLGISTSADKHYDFSVILTSAKGHNAVKVKLCDSGEGGDNIILFDSKDANTKLEAGEPKCIYGSDLEGKDINNLKIVFDFGGNAADDEIMIESLVLKDHANDDGTEVPEEIKVPFDYNTAGNLWKAVDEAQSFVNTNWFGDAGWGPIDCSPVITHEGSKHTIVIPVETPAEQWHAQWALTEVPISIKMGQKVDFSCRVTTTAKLPLATFKLCDTGNDDSYLFADMYSDVKGEYVVRYDDATIQGTAAGDMEKVKLVMDFAGAPKDAEITVSDIVLIVK